VCEISKVMKHSWFHFDFDVKYWMEDARRRREVLDVIYHLCILTSTQNNHQYDDDFAGWNSLLTWQIKIQFCLDSFSFFKILTAIWGQNNATKNTVRQKEFMPQKRHYFCNKIIVLTMVWRSRWISLQQSLGWIEIAKQPIPLKTRIMSWKYRSW